MAGLGRSSVPWLASSYPRQSGFSVARTDDTAGKHFVYTPKQKPPSRESLGTPRFPPICWANPFSSALCGLTKPPSFRLSPVIQPASVNSPWPAAEGQAFRPHPWRRDLLPRIPSAGSVSVCWPEETGRRSPYRRRRPGGCGRRSSCSRGLPGSRGGGRRTGRNGCLRPSSWPRKRRMAPGDSFASSGGGRCAVPT